MRRMTGYLLAGGVVLLLAGCATLRQMMALEQVRFELDGVSGVRLAGLDLDRRRSYSALSAADVLALGAAVARKDLPLALTVQVRAENPADAPVAARLTRLEWTLYLDDVETIHGTVADPVDLPAGEPRLIPVTVDFNLFEFFDDTARNLFDLAAALLSDEADPVTISLYAIPTVTTPLGPIAYPEPIRIVRRTVDRPASSPRHSR